MSSNLNKRLITLGIMGIVVLALFLLIRLVDFGGKSDAEPTVDPFGFGAQPVDTGDQPGPLFGDAQFGQVTEIAVQNNATGDLFKARLNEDGAWEITSAIPDSNTGLGVDSPRLESALTSVPALRPNNVLSEVEAMITYGLSEPEYNIWLTFDIGQTYTLFIGDQNPGGTAFYSIVSGKPAQVYLLPQFTIQAMLDFVENPPFIQPIDGGDGEDEGTDEGS